MINLYSVEAEELLMATCAQETQGGTYLIQETKTGIFNKGGLGIYQMEPLSYSDLWKYLNANKKEVSKNIIESCGFSAQPEPYEMVWNLQFATNMARAFYLRDKNPLPAANDIDGLWETYKRVWNTAKGAATKEQFVRNYNQYARG